MTSVLAPEEIYPATSPRLKTSAAMGFLTLLLIALLACFAIWRLSPPPGAAASAPATEFSAARALKHVEAIAVRPHPVGSTEHANVRRYISEQLAALGIESQTQEALVVSQKRGVPYQAANVLNVVGTLKGSAAAGGAVMLVGHYDSVPTGAGASDNGSAVASMLETARALKAAATPKNDVIFLFTDAEEVGLLGARAFVNEHARAKDVRVVLNFDARGNSGPATMFETSGGNDWLIGEFAKAAPRPSANSLSYEVYKLLPNTTDMTVFKEAGLAGLNFALVKGAVYYHTALDTAATMDERSLQHQGSTALSLARHFGNTSLPGADEARTGDAVYFDLLGYGLVRYAGTWALLLMGLALLLFVVTLLTGFRKGAVTLKGMALGFSALLAGMVGSAIVVTAVWWIVRALHSGYRSLRLGDIYNSGVYMLAFALLAAALTAALYALLLKRARAEDLAAGALLWWLLLTIATTLALPGASYLFVWPLLFGTAALCLVYMFGGREGGGRLWPDVALLVGALPGLALLVPMIYLIFLGMTLNMSGAVVVLVVLSVGLLVPHLGMMMRARRWLLPLGLAAASLLLIVAGSLTAGFDENRRTENNLLYALDADTGRAVWASADETTDEWTSQFFTNETTRGTLENFFPFSARPFMQAQAPASASNAARVELRREETNGEVRTLHLHVSSERPSPVVTITLDPEMRVGGSTVNGKRLDAEANQQGEPWALRYYGLSPDGLDLTLEVPRSQPVSLRVVEQTYGLPQLPGAPATTARPAHTMASTLPFSDSTFVTKSYNF